MRASFLVGLFVVVPLFVSWYFKGDPLVRQLPPLQPALFDEHPCL